MSSLRTITGALKTATGAPYADEPVSISFYGPSGTPGVLWLTSHKTERTDAEGVLTAQLYANEAGDEASFYRISVGEDSFEITVPAGEGPLSWSELRERGLVNRDWTQETVAHFIENNPALRGPPGPPGEGGGGSFTVLDTFATTAELPATGEAGDTYIAASHFWVWSAAAAAFVDSGPVGVPGEPGAPGPAGEPGEAGVAGASGPAGANGAQGVQGLEGPTGPVGPKGDVGEPGPAGEAGPIGPQGPAGETGAGLNIIGSFATDAELPATGAPGDAYIVAGDLYLWDPETSTYVNRGPIQGPAGPQGPVGPVGPEGPAGATGPQGPIGETGPQGLTGATGPAGPAGADGAQGPQGLQGEPGPQGPAGIKGDTGATGPIGATGATGEAGPQGIQGVKGDTGATGPTGATGATGPQGPKGDTGTLGPVAAFPEQTVLPAPAADNEQLFAVDVLGITSLRAQSPSGLVTDLQRDSTFVAGNNTGATIAKGRVVYTTGATNSSYGLPATRLPAIALASAAAAAQMPAIGVTLQNIPNSAGGRVMEEGMLTGVDTSAWAAGARLFVGADGLMTNVAPSDRVQRIGIVIRSHATEGQIWISVKTMFVQGEGTLLPSSGAITTHTLVWNASSGLANKYEPNPRPAQGYYRYVGPTDPTSVGGTLKSGDTWEQTF